jgi:hypothetical protein
MSSLLLTYGFLSIKKAAFMMSCECVEFFDSHHPLVYPVYRIQILVAYLVFEQAVYSLIDGNLCCSISHSSENKCFLWTCVFVGIVIACVFDHCSVVTGFCCIDS